MHLYASNSLPVNSLCQFQLFKFARNCTSAGATFGNYHRFSSLRTSPHPRHVLTCDFDLGWSCLLGAGEVPCAASVPASICLLDPRDHQVPLPHDLELVGRGEVQELPILDPPEHIGDENLKNRDLSFSPDHRFGVTLWRRTAQNDIVPYSCRCLDGAHQELALDVCKGNIQ